MPVSFFATSKQWQGAVSDWEGIGNSPAKQNRPFRTGFKVLENDFLEKYFATAHWSLPGLWAIPVMIYLLYRAAFVVGHSPATIVSLFVCGGLGWTLFEYWLHRWIFHLRPSKNPFVRTVQFMLHGYHHEFPEDPSRLVAPLVMAVPIFAMLTTVVVLCFPGVWTGVLAGTLFGYVCYDWVHYYSHHGNQKTALGRLMRRNHMAHHYRDASIHFGLSTPLWDFVFRTYSHRPARVKSDV